MSEIGCTGSKGDIPGTNLLHKIGGQMGKVCMLIIAFMYFLMHTGIAGGYGDCGENLTWEYEGYISRRAIGSIPFRITGTGEMTNYSSTGDSRSPFSQYYSNYMESLIVENGVESIGKNAFRDCIYLNSAVLPESITSIGEYAFAYCDRLWKVNLPSMVRYIGKAAFSCTNLATISIPHGVEAINQATFYKCGNLQGVSIPASVITIGKSAFAECVKLEKIWLPYGLESIEDQSFRGCERLTELVIPESVNSIGNEAFKGCIGLSDITISDGVSFIGRNTFDGCPNLTIHCNAGSEAERYSIDNKIPYDHNTVSSLIGRYITFGSYDQDNNPGNGKEPIEWLILDVNDDNILVISRYGLACKPYHDEIAENIDWRSSSLRSWCNQDFLSEAFTDEERRGITTNIITDNIDGIAIEDSIFIFNLEEILQWLPNEALRSCVPTFTAVAQGSYVDPKYTMDGQMTCAWWIRDSYTGISHNHHSFVHYVERDGTTSNTQEIDSTAQIISVRPVMNIRRNSLSSDMLKARDQRISIHEGDYITLGRFEQDGMEENGPEPIEWLVLEVQESRALLLSKFILHSMSFYFVQDEVDLANWRNCDVRTWLNQEFYWDAFDLQDRARIIPIVIGSENQDYLFILSKADVEKRMKIVSTKLDGYSIIASNEYHSPDGWWLRTVRGAPKNQVYYVTDDGKIKDTYCSSGVGVRPAMWIDISTDVSSGVYERLQEQENQHLALKKNNELDTIATSQITPYTPAPSNTPLPEQYDSEPDDIDYDLLPTCPSATDRDLLIGHWLTSHNGIWMDYYFAGERDGYITISTDTWTHNHFWYSVENDRVSFFMENRPWIPVNRENYSLPYKIELYHTQKGIHMRYSDGYAGFDLSFNKIDVSAISFTDHD